MNRTINSIIIMAILFIFSQTLEAKNLGHRAGGGKREYWKTVPENSLIALQYSLIGNSELPASQLSEQFLYLEFDVQETYDGELVIFHDSTLTRMIPNEGKNKETYKRIIKSKEFKKRVPIWRWSKKFLRIKDFTYAELRQFRLKGQHDQHVPTLKEFLEMSAKLHLQKPMAVEVKNIYSDLGKHKLINLVGEFQSSYMNVADIIFAPRYDMPFKAGFLAFPHTLYKTFGLTKKSRRKWCDLIIEKGLFGIFKPGKHNNQCD